VTLTLQLYLQRENSVANKSIIECLSICFSHSCIEFCAFIADSRSLESLSQHKTVCLATRKWASNFTFSDTCCSWHLWHFASKVQHVYIQTNTKQGSFKTANHHTICFWSPQCPTQVFTNLLRSQCAIPAAVGMDRQTAKL